MTLEEAAVCITWTEDKHVRISTKSPYFNIGLGSETVVHWVTFSWLRIPLNRFWLGTPTFLNGSVNNGAYAIRNI